MKKTIVFIIIGMIIIAILGYFLLREKPVLIDKCGNGICQEGEEESCPEDCRDNSSIDTIVSFKASDGETVRAYLLKPGGNEKFPAIIFLHGGMSGAQATLNTKNLAEKYKDEGYVALGVDFRSSEFGGKEIDDAIAGINYLKTLPYVDGDKIAIFGTSHGAYMSLMTAVRAGNEIKVVVDNFGFTDLIEQYERLLSGELDEWKAPEQIELYKQWADEIFGGHPDEFPEIWMERSPVFNADKIEAKVLIIHGKQDRNVPISQSYRMKEELEKYGKTVEMKVYEKGAHGFVYENTEEARNAFETTLDFLERNLK